MQRQVARQQGDIERADENRAVWSCCYSADRLCFADNEGQSQEAIGQMRSEIMTAYALRILIGRRGAGRHATGRGENRQG